jgi:cation:H+ antiporter
MNWLQFTAFSLWMNLAIFAGAAIFVWFAGARLAEYADAIGVRTGLSHALLGMVLLGVATSLPELATTVTGSLIGNARLVAGNLFGGVALQIAVLALVDLIAVRGALTYFTPQPVLLFQGVMLLLLLALALAGAASGEPVNFFGVGMTTVLLMGGYLFTVRFSSGGDYLPRWRATNDIPQDEGSISNAPRIRDISHRRLYCYAVLAGLTIFAAGWALASAGNVLAEQTGLGASFVGVALVAGSTSLPELSTTLGAVRRGNHEMAVSNILGTNCLEVALFFVADLCYRAGPILAATDRSALFAAALGMIVTCVFLLGLLERRDRTVLGMGVDSLLVLIIYIAGLGGLYYLR